MRRWLCLAALALLLSGAAHAAGLSVFCSQEAQPSAEQKHRLLLFAEAVRGELAASGHRLALIARSGIDLDRFGQRYSHAGISLRASPNTPWSVRQLYYACAEKAPRLYDQGLAGFLLDQDNHRPPYISLLFLPEQDERALEQAALDNTLALRLLASRYSADAYAFSTRFQNCNQWLIELIAHALGHLPADGDLRADAQQWLAQQRYRPSMLAVPNPLIALAGLMVPLLHTADHPPDAVAAGHYQVSLPASIEEFLRTRAPAATRSEICMNRDAIVLHRGWTPIPAGCVPAAGDALLPLS